MKRQVLLQMLLIAALSACGSIQPSMPGATSQPLPDLAISNLHLAMQGESEAAPFCVTAYAPYEMRATIENRGDAAAVDIVVSVPAAGHATQIDAQPAGQSAQVLLTATSPDVTYNVSVDPQNVIRESNEGNNTASVLMVTPTPPSLCPAATPTPEAALDLDATPSGRGPVNEFVEPVLADIRSRPADFEDTFDTRDRGWAVVDWCTSRLMSIEDGRLLLSGCAVGYERVNYRDYVIEVEAGYESGYRESGGVDLEFRGRACTFRANWNGAAEAACGDKPSGENARKVVQLDEFSWGSDNVIRMLLIVKGTRFAFAVDDRPLGTLEHGGYPAGGWHMGQGGRTEKWETVISFDNFRIWDITDLEVAP